MQNYTQLRVLSNIRKLQPLIDKIMANIFKLIDISDDPLYKKGIKEGEEKVNLRVSSKVNSKVFNHLFAIQILTMPISLF